jgi:predicted nucleic acid-binding protein
LGLKDVGSFLSVHRRVAIDSSVFICFLEANPMYAQLANAVFVWIEKPEHLAVTSTVTLTELLVHAYRHNSDILIDKYYGLFPNYPNLQWIAPDLNISDLAARIRAPDQLRTPDALQAATAIHAAATGFVTNDFKFQRVSEFETLVLDDVR